jgi:hypothetical protein
LGDFAKLLDQLNEARTALGRPVIERKTKVEEAIEDRPKQLSLF